MTIVLSNLNILTRCLLLLVSLSLVNTNKDCSIGPCFPSSREISRRFPVQVNSTCGLDKAEEYCVIRPSLECGICNASHPNQSHPSTYINDLYNLRTFWKSANLDKPVFLQFDFAVQFMLYQSVVTFQFELPAAMYFSKSRNNGLTFEDLAFYATDCSSFFNMTTTETNSRNGTAVECFKIDRTKNKEKVIQYGPMKDEKTSIGVRDSQQVQEYFIMTNFRLVLVSYEISPGFNVSTASNELKKSLSFTIQDWDVTAACFCNGQASNCDEDNQFGKCLCERNTAGNNCERCLPLYNNKTYEVRKACEACGCNNHAKSCHYSATRGYGVCDNCTDNTMGDKCESCKIEYYRPQTNLSYPCLACSCNLSGVKNTTNRTHCHHSTGQCVCKERVAGRACDTCKPSFWNLKESNLLGCQDCECTLSGTRNHSNICDSDSGQCLCKVNIDGRNCSKCKDGYYNLTQDNPDGCLTCNCNPAGSVSVKCNSTGGCTCRPSFSGFKCESIDEGYYVPSVDTFTLQAESGVLSPDQEKRVSHSMLATTSGNEVLFVGLVLRESDNVTNPTRLIMNVSLPKTAFYTFSLRYMTNQNWNFLKLTAELRSVFTPFTCNGVNYTSNQPHVLLSNATADNESALFGDATCMREGFYTVTLELPPGSSVPSSNITVDSVVILPAVTLYPQFKQSSLEEQTSVTTYSRWASNLRQWSAYSNRICDALSRYYGYLFGQGHACSCNTTGAYNSSVCDKCGGQCSCKPHVIGRTCDECRPDYYNFTSGSGCQACSCHLTGSNHSSCHPFTGQCTCKPNVQGKRCDRCIENHFNIASGSGCYPCECNSDYSTSLQCSDTGVCPCKPGVGGTKCTRCDDRFANLTNSGCTGCNCNTDGSQGFVCNKTTGQCPCRKHSVGKTCDTCPTGFYGLRAPHPEGCLKCQCSNKTNNCTTSEGWYKDVLKTELLATVNNNDMGGWMVVTENGQNVSSARWVFNANYWKFGKGFLKTLTNEEQYFSAPESYIRQGRFAYTYEMSFYLQQDNVTSPDNSSKGDVILNGTGFSQPIVYRLPSPPKISFTLYTIKFVETDPNWHVGNTLGPRPTSEELMAVLSTLEHLKIRAKWTTYTDKNTRLTDMSMGFSNRTGGGDKAENVESCSCPKEYDGQFCEQCAAGYTRVIPNGGAYVDCVPCSCNGHTNSCHPETGVCLGCQHNTTGDHCERCEDGLYGNAANGTADDCKPCPCPGGPFSTNQFSPTCYLDFDGQPTCDNCTRGHDGRRCENCTHGYYGKPQDSNGHCQLCNCNDNVNINVPGNCNTTTGQCYNCGYNTTGNNCEWCDAHYNGNALNKTCKRCECNSDGTMSDIPCNRITGQCACHPNVEGLSCDKCIPNTFNHSSGRGCSNCNCHSDGAVTLQCNLTTGVCDCHRNVTGEKCDQCKVNYYDVTKRCVACDCHANYTMLTNSSSWCDGVTGQCKCRKSLGTGYYGGQRCDGCETHSYGKPKNCTKCTEPCYYNWYNLIQVEKEKVTALAYNVTGMLKDFGDLTYDFINSTIQDLNKNLTYAETVFNEGANYNTKEKHEQITRIRQKLDDIQRTLNQTERVLNDAEKYLMDTVSGFNGTVQVVPALPDHSSPVVDYDSSGSKVYADWATLLAMATVYKSTSVQLNESGHDSYKNITSSYETIKLANETAALAASHISDAMARLDQLADRRTDVERRLDPSFQEELRNNSLLLAQITMLSDEIESLLKFAVDKGNEANATASEAGLDIKSAFSLATQRKSEAEKALSDANNASTKADQVKTKARNAQAVTSEFKTNTSAVLSKAKSALENVTDGINTIAVVLNKSRDSEATADRVISKTLPVTVNAIQDVANQIRAIEVDSDLINKTQEGAAEGLKQAKQIEALSERAINVSEATLNKVQSIEKAVGDAQTSRAETERLQKETDDKVQQMKNITQQVQSKASQAVQVGDETLRTINETLSIVDDGLKCYNDSKRIAKEAVVTAEKAYNLSLKAAVINKTLSVDVASTSSVVEKLYNVARDNYTNIVQAHNESLQVLKDVEEAEVLLKDYIVQRKEMERLKNETEELETELENLIRQFDEESQKYSNCKGGS